MRSRTFVLVQGAWGSSASWTPVARLLREAGHDVHVPSLTGLGERKHLFSGSVNLATHIDDVVRTIEAEGLDDLVLSGHSYGGMVITGVADRMAGRIAGLAYLDAFLPQDGQSLFDLLPEEHRLANIAEAGENGGIGVPPLRRHGNRVPEQYRHYMQGRSLQPIGTMVERLKLAGANGTVARRLYVSAVLEQGPQFKQTHARLLADPDWDTVVIETGHMLHLESPEETAAILMRFAEEGGA